ncbi:hypothetical protein SUGI_1175710 [Cryptomeria japonica]|nr:hypothetical protein SUGI_1175710 [Cryptomeria japonica]
MAAISSRRLLDSYTIHDDDVEMVYTEEHIDVVMKDACEEQKEKIVYCYYCNKMAGDIKDPIVNLSNLRMYCKACLRYCNRGSPIPRHIRVFAPELGECSICMEGPCENPTITLCGHFFCGQCLVKWAQKSRRRTYACPLCKTRLNSTIVFPLILES